MLVVTQPLFDRGELLSWVLTLNQAIETNQCGIPALLEKGVQLLLSTAVGTQLNQLLTVVIKQ